MEEDMIKKDENINNEEPEKREDKLQYKQLILIVLLTVIMISSSLILSFSVVNLLEDSKEKNFNTIIVPIKPTPGHPTPPGKEEIVFNYKEKETLGNRIFITNMFPTRDEVGREFSGDYYTFEFNLYFGNKSFNRYYEVTAEKILDSTLPDEYAKIYLEVDDQVVPNVLNNKNRVKVFSDYENATVDPKNDMEKLIYSGVINKRDIVMGHKRFVLKMWLAENTPLNSTTMDKKFGVRINVYAK